MIRHLPIVPIHEAPPLAALAKTLSLAPAGLAGTALRDHIQGCLSNPHFQQFLGHRGLDLSSLSQGVGGMTCNELARLLQPLAARMGRRDYYLERLRLPKDTGARDVSMTVGMLLGVQDWIRNEIDFAVEKNAGVLRVEFFKEIRGLERELCYLWMSGFEKMAGNSGLPHLATKIREATSEGVARLLPALEKAVQRTRIVSEYQTVLRDIRETESPWALVRLLKNLPDLLGILLELRNEAKRETQDPAGRKENSHLLRELEAWPRLLDTVSCLKRLESPDLPGAGQDSLRSICRLQQDLSGLLDLPVMKQWLADLGEDHEKRADILKSFAADGRLANLLSFERLRFSQFLRSVGLRLPVGRRYGIDLLNDGRTRFFVGPVAEVLAVACADWQAIFGLDVDPLGEARYTIKPTFLSRSDSQEIADVILYENGLPAAALFPVTLKNAAEGDVQILMRIKLSPPNEDGTTVDLTALDPAGLAPPCRFSGVCLSLEEGRFGTARFLAGDSHEITVGLLPYHRRRTLTVQDRKGSPIILATPLYPPERIDGPAREFEHLAGIIPHLPPVFRQFVEDEIAVLYDRLAHLRVGTPQRRELTRVIEASPFRMRGRLLSLMTSADVSPEARDFAAHHVFGRRYRRWGKAEGVEKIDDSTWAALVVKENKEKLVRHVVAVLHHVRVDDEEIEEGFRRALESLEEKTSQWNVQDDGVVDLILSERQLAGLRALQEGTGIVVADSLEKAINVVLAEDHFKGVRDRIWRITIEVARGPGVRPERWTFRNRALYDEKWQERSGYHVLLPKTPAFPRDPALDGADPLDVEGLSRLGAYDHIEVVEPFDLDAARVLVLHGRRDNHYYLTSRIAAELVGIDGNGRLGGLVLSHRRATTELGRQLANAARWPSSDQAPHWNRLRFHLEGVLGLAPDQFEEMMNDFAQATVIQREGLFVEKAVVEATLEFAAGLETTAIERVVALVAIEDRGGLAALKVLYVKEAEIEGRRREVLVTPQVLRRLLADPGYQLQPGEWEPADEHIRDKEEVDRRREVARRAGYTFIYDRILSTAPAVASALWASRGRVSEDPVCDILGEFVFQGGDLKVIPRDPGQNDTAIVGFHVRVRLPGISSGQEMVFVGHDKTHRRTPNGALGLEGGRLLQAIVDWGTDRGIPVVYFPETPGAWMDLFQEVVPRSGDALRVRYDRDRRTIYIPSAAVEEILQTVGATDLQDVMPGEWQTVAGERRFYPTDFLIGGRNVESLRGSAMSAGAFSRAAERVPTFAALFGKKAVATGIGLYNFRLCRVGRVQMGPEGDAASDNNGLDSFIILTGPDAINKMRGVNLFPDLASLGGSRRMLDEGMTTRVVGSEPEGLLHILDLIDRRPSIPAIKVKKKIPGAPRSFHRVTGVDSRLDGDLSEALDRSRQKIVLLRQKTRLPFPQNVYDTCDEIEALADPGSFVKVPGQTHHAVMGFGTLDGYPIALWGVQMLPEFQLDERGRLKIVKGIPQVRPGMVLPAEAADELATFLENLPSWLYIVSDPAAAGYDPTTVAASGEHGARLASAQALHPAPQDSWIGEGKRVLGGMYVTIGPDLSREGRIRLTAAPTAMVAVLDPKGWKGIPFYRKTLENVARILRERDHLSEEEARKEAEWILDDVIAKMSTIRRAKKAGAIHEIVEARDVRRMMAERAREWYSGEEFKNLYGRWL